MHTRSRIALAISAAPLAVAAMFVTTPVASADSEAWTPGARATFASENEVFRLYDTACDNRTVYLLYRVGTAPTERLNHSGGCNTNSTWNLSFAEGARISYWACVNIPGAADRCSGETNDIA